MAGGLVNALVEAQRLKMDCVQVFTANQRQWALRPLGEQDRADWLAKLKELGWHRQSARRTVAHNSYLVNLASPDRALWQRSLARQRAELERCEALRIPYCVAHPGAHMGRLAVPSDERAGIRRVARALDRIHRDLPGLRVITCLETTVGAGTTLGRTFEQLALIRDMVREPQRVGYCFDTCHVTAAGYDMTTDARAAAVLREFRRVCGRGQPRVFHINDSVGAVGSHRDRHAHIGHGACGLSCFRAIVSAPSFARTPKILETPKGDDGRGTPWDVRNIRRLKRLV